MLGPGAMGWLTALVALSIADPDARLSPPTRYALETRLAVWREVSGHAITVTIARDAGAVGDRDVHLALGTAPSTMDMAVGPDLAGVLTPAVVQRLDRVVVRPRLEGHDLDGAALAGVSAIITLVDVADQRRPAIERARLPAWVWATALAAVALVALLGVAYPELALLLALGGWFGVSSRARRAGSSPSARKACARPRSSTPRPGLTR